MKEIRVPYGKGWQSALLPDDIPLQMMDPECPPVTVPTKQLLSDALDHPIGCARLEEMVSPGNRVLMIVNDQTRPGPNREMAEAVLERLKKAGVPDNRIRIMIATGSHRAPTEEEKRQLVGDRILERIRVDAHDCRKNNVCIGTTESGLPVWVDQDVVRSDFVITTGLVAPHKTAGFSGGRKSIVPGVAGIETLKIHHSLPIRPFEPSLGWMEENPFHLAALEAAKVVRVRFILNAVQDPQKQNVAFVAGDLEQAHMRGVAICREHNTVECTMHGDLVIASPGGAPRDCNLYQAQKALATAEVFAAGGGHTTMILVAEAADGIGPELFQRWLIEAEKPEDVIERFRREGFDVGTNKAFEYARALTKGRLIVVSGNVDAKRLHDMKMELAADLQTAVDMALKTRRPEQVIVLPKAVSLIPHFTRQSGPDKTA